MRRPARFFHHFIREDGQIWLDDGEEIVNVEYTAEGWHIDVVEYGADQDLSVEHGRAQFKSDHSDGGDGA